MPEPKAGRTHCGLSGWLISQALHQPWLIRLFAALLRRCWLLRQLTQAFGGHADVLEVLGRPGSFSNTSHAPNLTAGPFLIGMDVGPAMVADRRFLAGMMLQQRVAQQVSARQAQQGAAALLRRGPGEFDLINDYLVHVAWAATRAQFADLADALTTPPPADPALTQANQTDLKQTVFRELQVVASHLVVGPVASASVQARAEACADALRHRVWQALITTGRVPAHAVMPDVWSHLWSHQQHPQAASRSSDDVVPASTAAGSACPMHPSITTPDALLRNIVGLLWVSHPVVVQAGALMLRELLARPAVLRRLSARAQALGPDACTDATFRRELSAHVLELLRFRPVFPLLVRDVPRATQVAAGNGRPVTLAAGASVKVLAIGAMFDPAVVQHPSRYWPQRWAGQGLDQAPEPDSLDDTLRRLVFGAGDRACLGRDAALEVLVSALAGLLTLPGLRWQHSPWPASRNIRLDGPLITGFSLSFGRH